MEKTKFKERIEQQSNRAVEQENTNAKNFSLATALLRYWAVGFILLLTLSGCGYALQGTATLPFTSIKIGKIENRTFEPKLEDRFKKALADELIKNGIMISKSAGHIINGTIEDIKLKSLSEKQGVAVEYEVIIKGKFFLTSPAGKTVELRNKGVFIVSFYGDSSIENLMASKEQALDTAMKNLASEIRAGIVYSQ